MDIVRIIVIIIIADVVVYEDVIDEVRTDGEEESTWTGLVQV